MADVQSPLSSMVVDLTPKAVALDAKTQPTAPPGMLYFNLIDPNAADSDLGSYPVLQIGQYYYWALSYSDNRFAYSILVYDQDKHLVRSWSRPGARYIWKINVDEAKQTVQFIGQANRFVEFPIDELLSVPIVTTADSALQPTPPHELKYANSGASQVYPVVQFLSGFTFWALSYIDNHLALAILAYDKDKTLFGRMTKDGARFIQSIAAQENQIVLTGQSNKTVSVTADELYGLTRYGSTTGSTAWVIPGPRVKILTMDATKQPRPPAGLDYMHLINPYNLIEDNTVYPVVQIGQYTYWALSYRDNRYAFAILAYDQHNHLVGMWSKSGARYLWKITVDVARNTIQFIGQSAYSVHFTVDELSVVPIVTTADAFLQPKLPAGLQYVHLTDPYKLVMDDHAYPVLKLGSYTYWATSYVDNQEAYAILAYDKNRTLVKAWTRAGARYIYKVTVDLENQTVQFIGQGNRFVEFTIEELLVIPTVTDSESSIKAEGVLPQPDPSVETLAETVKALAITPA